MAPTFPNSSGTGSANYVSFTTTTPTREQIVGRLLQSGQITSEEAVTLLTSPVTFTTTTAGAGTVTFK